MKKLLIGLSLIVSIASWANSNSEPKKLECSSESDSVHFSFEFDHEFQVTPSQVEIRIFGDKNVLIPVSDSSRVIRDNNQNTKYSDVSTSGIIYTLNKDGYRKRYGTFKIKVSKVLVGPSESFSEGTIDLSNESETINQLVTCKVSPLSNEF